MARVIAFYIPDSFKPKPGRLLAPEGGHLLEFPAPEHKNYTQPTWIFPEVDPDLSAREG